MRKASSQPLSQHPLLVTAALLGFVLALGGTYWDDAWHTEEGRDTFFIAPHLLLYAGISVAGASLCVWGFLYARSSDWRQAVSHPPLLLALGGVSVTLAAAPVDNGWHEAFGRDAVLWSPPHMLGIAGSAAIGGALLLELGGSARSRFELGAAVIAGAAMIAVAATPVLEFETDVPQFDLVFYLPVLATGAAFAFGLTRMVLPLDRPATVSAVAYTVVLALVALALSVGERPAPLLPLLIAPAIAYDLSRRASPLAQAAIVTAVLFATYVPYLNWLRSDVFLDAQDVLLGAPLALLGVALALILTSRGSGDHRVSPRIIGVGGILLLILALPTKAMSHDPGQGEEVTTASVTASVVGELATVTATPASHCNDLEPSGLTARRAGETLEAGLVEAGSCRFTGEVSLPDRGRWFLYVELDHNGRGVETWLPVDAGSQEVVTEQNRSLYEPTEVASGPLKLTAGIVLYILVAGIFVTIPAVFRRMLGAADG